MIRCCEECLGPPGEDGQCPAHPFARLILMDEDLVQAERALLRDMRQRRIFTALGIVSITTVASVISIGLLGAYSTANTLLGLLLLLSMLTAAGAAVLVPPVLMARYAGIRASERWPVWATSIGLGVGWICVVLLTVLLTSALGVPNRIAEPLWIASFYSPALLWLVGLAASAVTWKQQRDQRRAEWAEPTPQEAVAARKRAAQAARQGEVLKR